MDWAEELKMSIRKTTARKGRRSKSRDLLKDSPSTAQTSASATSNSTGNFTGSNNPELSIDITLDMQSQQQPQTASSGNNISIAASLAGAAGDMSNVLNTVSSDSKRPPAFRRISGGWADSAIGNKLKYKKDSFEDDRFGLKSSPNNSPTDDIPIIPDLDDIKDDILMNEIAEPPSVFVNRVVTLKELNSDLLAQNAFSEIEDVDLSILTKCLQPQESLDETDEVWEWEKLFTDVVAEINADKPLESKMKNLELRPDELPKPND